MDDNSFGSQTATITAVSTQNNLQRYKDYTMSTGTSSCIETFCKSLTLQAKINDKFPKPNDNLNGVMKSTYGIAFYRSENAYDRFSNRITIRDILNPTVGGPFFRDKASCTRTPESNSLLFDVLNPDRSNVVSEDLKWHKGLNPETSVCYVKITTEDTCRDKDVKFLVKSTDDSKDPHIEEGYMIVSTSESNRSACAEFKCQPGTKKRVLLVTVTPLVTGTFTTTKRFMDEHKDGGSYKVFVGSVVSFRPSYNLKNPSIGIINWGDGTNKLGNNMYHNRAKRECESVQTIAGIRFDCS